jgi:hypothetical protein
MAGTFERVEEEDDGRDARLGSLGLTTTYLVRWAEYRVHGPGSRRWHGGRNPIARR